MSESNSTAIDAMFAVGAHYGYSKTRRHPGNAKYIFGTKSKVDIIDLEKTEAMLEAAKAFVASMKLGGKQILFVGTKPEAKGKVKSAAEEIGMPSVTERWVGGVLTNYPEIKKRVIKLEDLRAKKEKNELDMYTKKERLLIDEEMARMSKNFSGIVNMKRSPDALFVVDPKKEYIAIAEARQNDIPIIALMSTDCNMKEVTYPILANDGSVGSIAYFIDALVAAYKEA
ncbi:30S ribosomal protein S2 [Candidatus Nomurabacteria bacterium]|jgi:small subunit ribosomal protein S2|nr:MAG: 30S ribosomal protein S2 [Candidatus Nomurabacteria bacterium]